MKKRADGGTVLAWKSFDSAVGWLDNGRDLDGVRTHEAASTLGAVSVCRNHRAIRPPRMWLCRGVSSGPLELHFRLGS